MKIGGIGQNATAVRLRTAELESPTELTANSRSDVGLRMGRGKIKCGKEWAARLRRSKTLICCSETNTYLRTYPIQGARAPVARQQTDIKFCDCVCVL